jgi:Flp pilus assembly protein TadD
LRFHPGAPPPPTGAQLVHLYRAEGPANGPALEAMMKLAGTEPLIAAAAILFDSGEKKEALDILKRAMRLRPRSAAICSSLAEALQQTGDRDAAAAAYEKALALLPADDTLTDTEKAQLRQSIDEARKK